MTTQPLLTDLVLDQAVVVSSYKGLGFAEDSSGGDGPL